MRDTIHYFWLDNSPHLQTRPRIDNDSLNPTYVLRKLRYQTKKEFGERLIQAYLKGQLPTEKNRACAIRDMNEKINEEIIPFDQFKGDRPEVVKIKKIIDGYNKRVNKALEPYDVKVYAMPWEFND